MHLQFPSGQLARLRDDARLLAECTGDHQDQVEAFVASSQRDMRLAEAAIAGAARGGGDQLLRLLSDALQRSAAGAAALEAMGVSARQMHVAAVRSLAYLGGDRRAAEHRQHVVLVADDSGPLRDVMASVLEDAGFVVRTAANGLEALIAAHDMRPAVIVMDVSMPVLDGIQATRLIKATETTRHARVIAYTGRCPDQDELGRPLFAAVLQKPVPADVLVATVQQCARPVDDGTRRRSTATSI